jgi:hypothetical protein
MAGAHRIHALSGSWAGAPQQARLSGLFMVLHVTLGQPRGAERCGWRPGRQRLAALRRRYTEERIAAHVAQLDFSFAQDPLAAARR